MWGLQLQINIIWQPMVARCKIPLSFPSFDLLPPLSPPSMTGMDAITSFPDLLLKQQLTYGLKQK
jgi:hypothetical protein